LNIRYAGRHLPIRYHAVDVAAGARPDPMMTTSAKLRPAALGAFGRAIRGTTPVPDDATTPQRHVDMLAVPSAVEREREETGARNRGGARMREEPRSVLGPAECRRSAKC
jgi:hypothetical protein